ncbi:MAG: CotH kinase family protein, partial [Clostridia bacterium]|nr:CotH kinase family protein [Clostridia bacterium]
VLLAAVVTVGALLPSVSFDSLFGGGTLESLTFYERDNRWLMLDMPFDIRGRELSTDAVQPYLIGETIIPTFEFDGDRVTFNGQDVTSGETAVELRADNEIVVKKGLGKTTYRLQIDDRSRGLPAVCIDAIGPAYFEKYDYTDVEVTILGASIYGGENIYAARGGAKLRGNSTSSYNKRPFHIRLDEKANVFGLGSAKHWVLLANFLDPSSLRNNTVYSFASKLSALTEHLGGTKQFVPRTRAVEVYISGEFQGLYDLSDHIQVNPNRIDIDESGEEFDDDGNRLHPEGDVGYYLEIEDKSRVLYETDRERTYYVTISNCGGVFEDGTLYAQIKSPENPSPEQREFIQGYLQTVNDLILAKDDRVWDYIDIDSFIDWYLVNELFKNTDSAFQSSIKLYKDKGGKLCMGPVWDFDIGAAAVSYNGVSSPEGWLTRSSGRCGWYEALFSMPVFDEAVKARWAALHKAGILEEIETDVNTQAALISEAATFNYQMWHSSYVSAVYRTDWLHVPNVCMYGSWEEQLIHFKKFMRERIAWMDGEFGYRR